LHFVLILSTIVLRMRTKGSNQSNATLFGKTRSRTLNLLFSNPKKSFYIRQISRLISTSVGTTHREIQVLCSLGIINKVTNGKRVNYCVNVNSPIYQELNSLVIKTSGVAGIIKKAINSIEKDITIAFIFGSYAKGEQQSGSDIDILIVGDVQFKEVISKLRQASKSLSKEINPIVYPVEEFVAKVKDKDHFLTSVLKAEKIFLVGGDNELSSMV